MGEIMDSGNVSMQEIVTLQTRLGEVVQEIVKNNKYRYQEPEELKRKYSKIKLQLVGKLSKGDNGIAEFY